LPDALFLPDNRAMSIFQTIKFRIIALGVLLVFAGVAFRLAVALPFAQDLLRESVASEQLSIASYVARDIDHSVRARRALIGALAAMLPGDLLQRPAALAAWLQERQRINPLFGNGLFVAGPGGNLLAQYPVLAGRDRPAFFDADWFRAATRAADEVASAPLHRLPGGKPSLIMAAPVRDAAGKVVAVLAGSAALDAPGFLDLLQETRLGPGGGLLLISPVDKLFLAASDPSMVFTPLPPPGVNLLHDRAMAGFRGTGVTVNAKGVEELSAMVSVPSMGWFVVARVPTAQSFHPIHAMRSLILQGTLVVLVVLIAILILALPRILRPLTDAAGAMHDMADGKRELTPLPVRRRDEVGKLVLGFNYLVARLNEKEIALKASETRLEFMAHNDALTGLRNRAMLEHCLYQILTRAERDRSSFALLFCDLDDFKPVNDQFGHETGDAVLREVARRLLLGRRHTDTVARFGGDEFVVLLPDLQDASDAAAEVARQMLAAIGTPFHIEGKTITLAASIGIAVYDGAGATTSQLMSQADSAMYNAKRAGKNRFCIFGDDPGKGAAGDPPSRAAAQS
jgi:diguanylate cyclase (GGDEF)-like protein